VSFCPVCGAHHDPKMPCADRASELLRDVGIEQKPMAKKELKSTIKKANRSLVVLLIVVLSLFLLTILLSYLKSSHIDRQSARAYITSGNWWQDKGDYDRAIADYNETIRLEPQFATAYESRGITRFNKGEFSSAASDLAQSQQLKPDTYTAIWLYLARARSNSDGETALTLNTNGMDRKKWPARVVALYLGKADANTVTSQATDPDLKKHKEQLCEANFFLGEWHLLHNRKQQARMLFTKVQNECQQNSYEYWALFRSCSG
jgi:lipoprotein NlpI